MFDWEKFVSEPKLPTFFRQKPSAFNICIQSTLIWSQTKPMEGPFKSKHTKTHENTRDFIDVFAIFDPTAGSPGLPPSTVVS